MYIYGIEIKGKVIDEETRCEHYKSERDRIAIKFKCCNTYYPCIHCHNETVDHPVERWGKRERQQQAVLCGQCGTKLTIEEYMQANDQCPSCKASFNPGCHLHHHLYFVTDTD